MQTFESKTKNIFTNFFFAFFIHCFFFIKCILHYKNQHSLWKTIFIILYSIENEHDTMIVYIFHFLSLYSLFHFLSNCYYYHGTQVSDMQLP